MTVTKTYCYLTPICLIKDVYKRQVVTGAALLAASANGGFINVGANTGLMKNTEIAQKLNEEAKMLLSQTMKLHDSISQLMS